MLARISVIFIVIYIVNGEISQQGSETNRMMGIDTVHDIKIDKDTIITKNTIVQKKIPAKPTLRGQNHDEDRDPDWSYRVIPQDISHHVEEFKRNMTECLKEVQANDKRTVKRLSPKTESPILGDCLIACVLRKNGVIQGMKINKVNLINLVSKFYAKNTKLMKKLEKNVDRCIELSTRSRNECSLAASLNLCTNDLMASNKHRITVNYDRK